MRMPAYQLLVERSTDVVDVEARCASACSMVAHAALLGTVRTTVRLNLRVKNYLLKHIAKLFLKVLGRTLGNGLNRLVSLLNHVL